MKNIKVTVDCKMLDEYRNLQIYSKTGSELKYLLKKRMPKRKTMEFDVDINEDEMLVLSFEPREKRKVAAYCMRNIAGLMFALIPRISYYFRFINTCYQLSLMTEIECESDTVIELKYIASTDIRKPVEAIIPIEEDGQSNVRLSSSGLDFRNDYKEFNLGLVFSLILETIAFGILWIMNQSDWAERFSLIIWTLPVFSIIYFVRVMIGSNKEYKRLKENNGDLSAFISKDARLYNEKEITVS